MCILLLSNMHYALINESKKYWVAHLQEFKYVRHTVIDNVRFRQ